MVEWHGSRRSRRLGRNSQSLQRSHLPFLFAICQKSRGSRRFAPRGLFAGARKIRAISSRVCSTPWLYGIARHACLDQLKKKKLPRWEDCWSSRIFEEKMEDTTGSSLSKMVQHEDLQHLNTCLEGLNEELRMVVLFKHVEGLSRQEIGEIMGVGETRVKNLLFSGMQALKNKSKNF